MPSHAPILHPLTTVAAFDDALARSAAHPILIFKHSFTCGTSAYAKEELEALLAGEALSAEVYLVDVRAHRDVSNAITTQLHIRHESPQALLIHHGVVRWHASHFRVTSRTVAAALKALAEPAADASRA